MDRLEGRTECEIGCRMTACLAVNCLSEGCAWGFSCSRELEISGLDGWGLVRLL